jgi:hypothetical protein
MAFQNLTFLQVEQTLGLTLPEANLFVRVEPHPILPAFAVLVAEGADLAAAVNSPG